MDLKVIVKNSRNNKGPAQITKQGGFTLIETLFYIAIFVILSIVVINSLIVMAKAFKQNSIQSDIVESGAILERMTREIKQAESIASVAPTTLRLNTTDEAGGAKIVQFTKTGVNLVLTEDDVTTGNLNSPNIEIESLSFTQITTANGLGVKINLSVSSSRDTLGRVYDFYSTAVLRGSY